MILPPHLLNYDSGYTAGQFPKFAEDVFWLEGAEPKKFLLPTAETALVNLHRNEILSLSDLPRKYFAYTPCYRKEAGSYRTEERGMIRGYQFNKVEMVKITKPEQSYDELESMTAEADKSVMILFMIVLFYTVLYCWFLLPSLLHATDKVATTQHLSTTIRSGIILKTRIVYLYFIYVNEAIRRRSPRPIV